MASFYPATIFPTPFFNKATGELLANGTLSAYYANITTPAPMFVDAAGTSAGSVITLNAGGYPEVGGNIIVVWLHSAINYKFILATSDASQEWTVDDISGFPRNSFTVADYSELATLLQDDTVPTGTLIWTLSPSGYYYEKKQGVATDDGIRIITENRGTTTAGQHYGELTGAPSKLPEYATAGDFYADTAAADAYVLTLPAGEISLPSLNDGQRFRFLASADNTGASTVDLSSVLNQTAGTSVKSIKLANGNDPPAGYISGYVTLIYDQPNDRMVLDGDLLINEVATDRDEELAAGTAGFQIQPEALWTVTAGTGGFINSPDTVGGGVLVAYAVFNSGDLRMVTITRPGDDFGAAVWPTVTITRNGTPVYSSSGSGSGPTRTLVYIATVNYGDVIEVSGNSVGAISSIGPHSIGFSGTPPLISSL